MGPRKLRHPPRFVIDPDYHIYRDRLLRWVEAADYTRAEMASMVFESLPGEVKMRCAQDVGECFLGNKSLHKVIQWLDETYDHGWSPWLDNAKKDKNCYESFVPVPRSQLTFKFFIKWTAKTISGGNTHHGVMICPEDVEPFELWPGNRFKRQKEGAKYTGKYFMKKKVADPNSMEVITYDEDGNPLGTHVEAVSEYALFLNSDTKNYQVSHKANTQ